MAELMLVNPRRKTRRKATTRRRKSPSTTRRRRRTTTRRATAARRAPRRRSAPVRRTTRRRRRSPRMFGGMVSANFFQDTLIPSAIGGAGALGVDIIWAMLPIPPAIKGGAFAPIAKIAGAVLIGGVAGNFAGKKMGERITAGYLTVTAYDMIKNLVGRTMPNLPLSEYDYPHMGYVNAAQTFPDAGMGAYIDGMGNYIPEGATVYIPDESQLVPADGMSEYISGYGEDVF